MASEWKTQSVAELQVEGALLVEDGNHGENRPRPDEFSTEGIQFIRAADMDGGRVLFEKAQRINEIARQRVRKGIGAGGDVLLSHKGTVGKVAYVPLDAPPFVCSPQTTFWRVTDSKQLDRRYVYFFLLSRTFREQLDSRKGETDMADYVSLTTQRTLKVVVPPLAEQRAIANILGVLDDKIELNRRMNETLEGLARAIFQSWFVDFDPVRAHRDGLPPPALSPATAALFPDSFEDSELGKIPKGWKWSALREIAEIVSGGTPHKGTDEFWNGAIPWISPKAMNRIHVSDSDEHVTECAVGNGTRRVLKGTVLVMVRGMGLHQGVRISQAQRDVTFNQDVKAIIAKSVPATFLLYGLLDAALMLLSKVHASGHGTGVLSTEFLDRLTFAIPPDEVLARLTKSLDSVNDRIASNDRETDQLAAIRDALLPKLLSGEIRVAEAERLVEDAG